MLPQITLHPNLRSFTWSRLLPFRTYVRQQYFIPNAVESCLSQYASQLTRIFECLSESHVLRILELSGWPLLNGYAGLRKMKVLEELYPCHTAQNTPSLRKLVLRFEGRSLAADPSNWPQGLSELQSTNSSSAVLEIWGVKDFGIYIPGEEIGVLSPLVEAIARLVPSIISFYGTGTMTVPAMMSVDLAWFGKLK
ncbi:hypothetical protein DL96DRAFT_1615509 [Flagelloscypha sp. PMI_526]|nr:hypothetical protein DL96DRAFT_1615509 [Flagelloscypha sp. PMI_526]